MPWVTLSLFASRVVLPVGLNSVPDSASLRLRFDFAITCCLPSRRMHERIWSCRRRPIAEHRPFPISNANRSHSRATTTLDYLSS